MTTGLETATNDIDSIDETFGDLAETIAPFFGLKPTRSLEELFEAMTLKRESPFDSRAYEAKPTGAARAAMVFEANPDAIRLWFVPMPRGKGPMAVAWK